MDILKSQLLLKNLLQSGVISENDLAVCMELVKDRKSPPIAALLRTGSVAETDLYSAAASFFGCDVINPDVLENLSLEASAGIAKLGLSPLWCKAQRLAFWVQQDKLFCLTTDLVSTSIQELTQQKSEGRPVEWAFVRPAHMEVFLRKLTNTTQAPTKFGTSLSALKELAEEGPIIELVNSFMSTAAQRRASDIHVEARESDFVVRLRIDGVMHELEQYPKDKLDATVCRLKILASLDIAERRLPQDGRISARLNGDEYDIRVSVLPASRGESVVLRLLRQRRHLFSLPDLGMLQQQASQFASLITAQNGIVLVTGPTGSGKSTTLYTGLSLVNNGNNKIVTVEDPVEYQIEGVTQTQVNSDIGFTFAAALRSILRHDPDVILIGEIRDKETAEIAIQSALTGHLVLSTLHTNSAIGSITRLIDMGVEPYLISASLRGAIAQRLVRRLCEFCSEPTDLVAEFEAAARDHDLAIPESLTLRQARAGGCMKCNHTGYMGRVAVYEFVEFDEALRAALRIHPFSEDSLLSAHQRTHVKDGLVQDALMKAAMGVTSTSEALSISERD